VAARLGDAGALEQCEWSEREVDIGGAAQVGGEGRVGKEQQCLRSLQVAGISEPARGQQSIRGSEERVGHGEREVPCCAGAFVFENGEGVAGSGGATGGGGGEGGQ
jgi:hypothetical protein